MPVLPAWSIEESVREAERVATLGLRGVNMTSDPQDAGSRPKNGGPGSGARH